MEGPVWCVWNPHMDIPRFQHTSEASARREAERLARQNPGQRFIVLKSVAEVTKNDIIWKDHSNEEFKDDHVPF